MNTTHRHHSETGVSRVLSTTLALLALIPTTAFGDFSGSDTLATKSSKWSLLFPSPGTGKYVFQNSRLEFLVKPASKDDILIYRWTPNKGAYDHDWFAQVDVRLNKIPLNNTAFCCIGLGVLNTRRIDQFDQAMAIQMDRYKDNGNYVCDITVGTKDRKYNVEKIETSDTATLRMHFDSTAKTLTTSWNNGSGWKYVLPAASISHWGMTNSDTFTLGLVSASGSWENAIPGPVINSGDACFTNFKTGPATPEIAVEQPVGSNLKDGTSKISFGSATVGGVGMTKTFTIKNTGTAKLTGLAITKNGTHAMNFSVTAPGKTSLPPGASTSFKVTFKPTATGTRTAAIHIRSNDSDENPFDIQLTGLGAAP